MSIYKMPRILTFSNFIKMALVFLICYSYLILTSCGAYKRKILDKYCQVDSVQTSVLIHDTIYTESIKSDTVFSIRDSFVVIEKDKLRIEYKRVKDRVFIQGECKADTIYKSKLVTFTTPCPQVNLSEYDKAKSAKWGILIAFLIGLTLGLYLSKK